MVRKQYSNKTIDMKKRYCTPTSLSIQILAEGRLLTPSLGISETGTNQQLSRRLDDSMPWLGDEEEDSEATEP